VSESISTSEDPGIAVHIEHHRDRLVFDGKVEQDYRFITYCFPDRQGEVTARTYLDEAATVSILAPLAPAEIHEDVLRYLQQRFDRITQLGQNGYADIWRRSAD
jgi:hypothetical protein